MSMNWEEFDIEKLLLLISLTDFASPSVSASPHARI